MITSSDTHTSLMGRQDNLSVLLRLIAMELYKFQRRRLAKGLLLVGIVVVAVIPLGLGIITWRNADRPASSFTPPLCQQGSHPTPGCVNQAPTQADREHYKQLQVDSTAHYITLPASFTVVNLIILTALVMLPIILIGTMAGSDYSLGTIRLLYTRGPTRLQFFLAKIATAAICIVPSFVLLSAIMIFVGMAIHPLIGLPIDLSFFSAAWAGHALLFLSLGALYWFVYAMMAICFATIGSSSIAGVVGPLLWVSIETILGNLIKILTAEGSGPARDFMRAIPDYFVANSLSSLLQNQGHILYGAPVGPLTDPQAWLVVLVYLAIFVGVALRLTVKRDITS